MAAIKLILISIVMLFLVITGISALLPSDIRVSRAVDINAGADKVRLALNNIGGWQKWNEFIKPVPVLTVSGDSLLSPEITVIITSRTEKEVSSIWLQPGHPELPSVHAIYSTGDITTLQWYFTCHFRWYPWEKLGSLIYDKQLGTPMEQSLQNLKQQLEAQTVDTKPL